MQNRYFLYKYYEINICWRLVSVKRYRRVKVCVKVKGFRFDYHSRKGILTLLKLNLVSGCIPSEVVRDNGAPRATVSTYLFRLVDCLQPLHTFPPGSLHSFYVTYLQYLWYCVLECQLRSPPTSLIAHFSVIIIFAIFSSLIRSTCQLSAFFFVLTMTS